MKNLAYFKERLAPFVGGTGYCVSDPMVLSVINEAMEILTVKADISRMLIRYIRFYAYGNIIAMPRMVDKILEATICGSHSEVHSKWYEFMSNGPGRALEDGSGYQDFIDRGESCTIYDIPETISPTNLLIYSDCIEDEDATITIRGLDETGREVFVNGTIGEELLLRAHAEDIDSIGGILTNNKFSKILSITKTATKGYIYLDTFSTETAERFHLATYHPNETAPSFRRYSLKGWNYDSGAEKTGVIVDALVRLRHVPLVNDSDVPLLQNVSAIKKMVQAINFYDSGEVKSGTAYETLAEKLLLEEAEAYEHNDNSLNIQMEGWLSSEDRGGML